MSHKEVATKVIIQTADREFHKVDGVAREFKHYSDWLVEKNRVGIRPVEVTNDAVVVEGLNSQTSWKAFDEELPNGDILRTIFIFQEPNWPTSDVTHP